jgi:hypothetical protein
VSKGSGKGLIDCLKSQTRKSRPKGFLGKRDSGLVIYCAKRGFDEHRNPLGSPSEATMNIIDRIFAGNVIKDFGTVDEKPYGFGKMKHTAMLVEKHGQLFFVLKQSIWGILGANVSYDEYALENADKIRAFILESEQIAKNLSPSTYNFSKAAIRYMLIVFIIASALIIFTSDEMLVVVLSFIATLIQVSRFNEFRSSSKGNSRTKTLLLMFVLLTIIVGGLKFLWLMFGK